MSLNKKLIKTLGLAYNVTDTICIGQLAKSWKFSHENTTEDIPYADRYGKKVLPVGNDSKFEAAIRELTAAWVARMTGGTVANGLMRQVKEVITRSGNTYTLTQGAGANQAIVGNPILVRDRINNTIRTQAGSAVTDVSYSRSGAVLTVTAGDASAELEVTYNITDTSASSGSKVIIPSQTMPGLCRNILPFAFIPVEGGAITKYAMFDLQKCQPTSGLQIGGEVQAFVDTPFSGAVLNESDGDVVVYFDTLNDLG